MKQQSRKADPSIDFESYFKVGISQDYILIRQDFPVGNIPPGGPDRRCPMKNRDYSIKVKRQHLLELLQKYLKGQDPDAAGWIMGLVDQMLALQGERP